MRRMIQQRLPGVILAVFSLIVFCLICLPMPALSQFRFGPPPEHTFRFRFVGPMRGNRVAAVAGVPGDPSTYYAGAASGGVWKSTDGGNNWRPIFDKEPAQAIGALAVASSDHNVVWAGTGEAWAIRDSDVMGDGVYKSTDAGKTWTQMGLDHTGRIGRIVIDPKDANEVFVCALGRTTGPQQERGVFRTMDGGKHWDRVLFVDEKTGCSGLAMDPEDSRTMFAGMWQVEMHTYAEISGGPGSGVYISHDGGTTWAHIVGHGLPKPPVGKIDVAVAPTNSNRVYALIETKDQGSVWRSDDGGKNWRVINHDRRLIGRAGYYIRIAVSPASDNEVYISNSSFFESLDGGETFNPVPWGGDNHDIWIDPTNANRFVVTDDGGLNITTVHGRGFNRVSLPIGQMYHVAVDNQIPYDFYTNMQDDGNMRGPSINIAGFGYGVPPESDWDHDMGGCESGFTLPDPVDPNIVWATCYGDEVTVWNAKVKAARSVSPYWHTLDSPPNEVKYRCHWTPPLAIDPFDPNTVYYGCQVIFKTSDGGQTWKVISPDLLTNNPSRIVPSGGLIQDNLGQFEGEVVFAIAPSQIQKGLIWAGTNDGQIWYTKDGGGHWTNVTKNVSGMPAWGTVTSIQPSFFDPGTAYVSVDLHLMDNRDPFIYKTTDYGQSWELISGGIPKSEYSYIRVIAEDPNCKGLLFAGTGNALYYSLDDGANWTMFDAGLPHAVVSWAVVQKHFHDLVVSTYGRGIYILDDISPLEQMAKEKSEAAVRLFQPRDSYRFLHGGGAFITYYLKSTPKNKNVRIEILDSRGNEVRRLHGPAKEGFDRVRWDFYYDPPTLAELRTAAPDNPYIWEEPRFRGAKSRPVTHWGIRPAEVGPFAAPGKYTIKLTVDGQSYTQPVTVLKDPHTPGTQADLEATFRAQMRLRNDLNETSNMINHIEWTRKQIGVVDEMLKSEQAKAKAEGKPGNAGSADLLKSVDEMSKKLESMEYQLISRENLNSDDKYYSAAYKIYLNLIWLNGEIGTGAGDVAGGANWAPTAEDLSELAALEKDLAAAKASYDNLYQKELPAFNRTLSQHGVSPMAMSAPAAPEGDGATAE